MQTSFHHLPAAVQHQLEQALELILGETAPEMILLLSPPASTGIDTGEAPSPYLDRLNFLLLLKEASNLQRRELQEKLESSCSGKGIPANVLVHTCDQINRMLQENPYLFPELEQEGILLYDRGSTPLAAPASPSPETRALLAQQHYDRWYGLAAAFYRSAQSSLFRGDLSLSAFLLHQSLEHAFTAVHLVFTGYRPTTHNLDKLRRYTSRFSPVLARVFPGQSPEENKLFLLLKTAYSRARYGADYAISSPECHILLGRARKLLLIARCICQSKLLSLQTAEASPTANSFLP